MTNRVWAALWALLLIASVILFSPARLYAQNTQNFTITSFDAEYYLTRDEAKTSQLKVIETIVAQFPEYDQNHGILRSIPQSYNGHTLSLHVSGVQNENGTPISYSSSSQSGNEILKIGDANTYVHGQKTYVITYSMKNVVAFFNDHDEFYWDINGDQWPQRFDSVTARIHLPPDIALNLQSQKHCYVGSYRSQNTCGITKDVGKDETVVTATAQQLQPYQTMTIVLGFGDGTFEPGPEIAREKLLHALFIIIAVFCVAGVPLLALAILVGRWRKYGRDPKGRGVIVPEYQPPKDFNALKSDYLLEEGLRTEAVTALLIELAVHKYLVIYETEEKKFLSKSKHYELELVRDPSPLSSEQQEVLKMIFGDSLTVGSRKSMDELRNKLASKVTALDKNVSALLTDGGYFTASPQKVRQKYMGIGSGLSVAGFVICFTGILLLPGIGLLLAGFITLGFAKAMPARSSTGVTLRDHLQGLKEYIKLAEAERLRFLQSPEGAEKIKATGIDPTKPAARVKLFEDLLPYAILFGLEKEWAKQFEDIYKEPPEWYHGHGGTFTAVYLASSINSLSTASAAAFTSPASSGSSGMGGGGFSGGGGGGGGGGGW